MQRVLGLGLLAIKCDLFLLIFLFAFCKRAWARAQLLPTSRLPRLASAHCPPLHCPLSSAHCPQPALWIPKRCCSHTLHSVTSARTLLQSQCHSMMQCSGSCSCSGSGSSYSYDPALLLPLSLVAETKHCTVGRTLSQIYAKGALRLT